MSAKFDPPQVHNLESGNPDYKELIQEKLKGQHFMRHIGFELTRIEPGMIEGEGTIDQFMTQQDGYVHGGVTATVADIVCGFAAFSLVHKDHHVVTGDLKLSFLSPGKGHTIMARGYVIKPGKRLNFCEGEVWVQNEEATTLIARAYATMASFLPRKD